MSNIILIDTGISEYGKHNLVADVLTLHSDELCNAWDTNINDFIAIYKRVNVCGKRPESHQDMFKRRFPDRVAQGETPNQDKATPIEKTPAIPVVAAATVVQPSAISNAPSTIQTTALTNAQSAITPKTAVGLTPITNPTPLASTEFLRASDVMAIMTSFSKPGISATEALAEFVKLANASSSRPADVGTAAGATNTASTKKALSPIRQLRDPYNNKVYFSREHTEEELLELEEGRVKAERLHRCFTLCLIDSVREDNFVEGSFLPVESTAIAKSQQDQRENESPDPCKKLSFETLVPHDGVTSNEEMSF
jgi:hypothetical protein